MFVIISGPSGSGKTPIIYKIIETYPNIKRIQSYTTRKIRNKEVAGTYIYMSKREFENKINSGFFFEFNKVHKDQKYYGTGKESYEKIVEDGFIPIKDIDVDGYKNLKQKIDDVVGIYLTVKDRNILFDRLRERGETEKTINLRLFDRVDYENAQTQFYDYVVYTDDFDKANKEIERIIDFELKKRNIKVKKYKGPSKIQHMF